jgi:hypothetical protein
LISDELGLNEEPRKLSEKTSLIFQRVYNLGLENYELTLEDVEYRYNSALSQCILTRNIRQLPSGNYSTILSQAFKEATQQNQAMIGNPVKGSRIKTFGFPKGAYARYLLSFPMPSNTNWQKVSDKDISGTIGTREDNSITGTSAFLKMCERKYKDKAMFLKLTVTYTSKYFRNFATFAMGSNYQRNWATLPEVIELAKYSVIEIHEAYICDTYNLDIKSINLDDDEYSYSRGLYLENLWTAYSLPIQNGEVFNPVGAYLRAYDRILCLKAANAFSGNNFKVGSFGTGRVVVYMKKHEQELATEIAISEGLMPPFYLVNNE